MQNGNQASAHLENKETNSATENGIMSPPTGERGVVPAPAAGVSPSQPLERGVLRRLKIEINDVVVGEVGVIKHPTTQMVESVIAQEYVAAVCELTPEQASSALSDVVKANPFLGQVFYFII